MSVVVPFGHLGEDVGSKVLCETDSQYLKNRHCNHSVYGGGVGNSSVLQLPKVVRTKTLNRNNKVNEIEVRFTNKLE